MIALYFLALFSLSQSANLVRLAQAPPDVIGFWRLLAASVLILPFAFKKRQELPAFRLGNYAWPALSSVFFFGHLWTYVYSAQHTTIAHCMIIFATNPLFTSLGAAYFFKDAFPRRLVAAYILAFIGLYFLLSQSISGKMGSIDGDISALISGILFAGYILTGKKSRQAFTNTHYTFVIYLLTALLFGINGASSGKDFIHYPPIMWACVVILVLMPTLLGHSLFSYLMKFMNIGLMTCGKLIEPLLSAVVAYYLFNETLNEWTVLSFIFMGIALIVLFWPEIKLQWKRGIPGFRRPPTAL
ncbi:MAG: DMT family transporter [Bdellovibrionota bacterium]